jgi:AraC-like DNA-binding protein
MSADPRYSVASVNPLTLRYLAILARERGYDVARLCRGLGFTPEDLDRPDFRISYRQGSLMIRRARQQIPDADLALAVGTRQTLVSWGLVGFGMMTCATLGEATELGLSFQKGVGSLVDIRMDVEGDAVAIIVDPMFFDTDIQTFLIEEAFASMVSIVRQMVGPHFAPSGIEVVYQRPAHAALYDTLFRCPIRFGCSRNRLITDLGWIAFPLPTHDSLVAKSILPLIEANFARELGQADIGATIERTIRDNMHDLPTLARIASTLNLSERTLRRKLTDSGLTYQGILDSVRKARALELLAHSTFSVAQVATEIGFTDVRNFRRAFKRWTGAAPTELRR